MRTLEERIVRKEEILAKLETRIKENDEYLHAEQIRASEQLWAVHNKTVAALQDRVMKPLVAFHATFVEATTPNAGQTIIFTNTLMNAGEGYDNITGIFTAPIGGVYQLSVHLCTAPGKYMYFDIVADEDILLSGVQGDKSYYSCGSVSIPAAIPARKQAYVRCSESSPGLRQRRVQTNTFSGVLIQQFEK